MLEDTGTGRPKELINIEKAIDFNRFYGTIQNFYDELKTELCYIMLKESEQMGKEAKNYKGEDVVSTDFINKLKNGSEQIYDVNYMMQLAVADKYSGIHTPIPQDAVTKMNQGMYKVNKDIKQSKMIKQMMEEYEEGEQKEPDLDPDYEFERE